MMPASYAPREPPPDITKPIRGRVRVGGCTTTIVVGFAAPGGPRGERDGARSVAPARRGLDLLALIAAQQAARLDPGQDASLPDLRLFLADQIDLTGDVVLAGARVSELVVQPLRHRVELAVGVGDLAVGGGA